MFEVTGALATYNGGYVTVVNGGGLGGVDSGSEAVALHSDGTTPAGWETFRMIFIDDKRQTFALQTSSGHFVTAMYGGGIGGPDDMSCPVHTDSTDLNPWANLTFLIDLNVEPPNMRIRTYRGFYLTATAGGGIGNKLTDPIQTNRVKPHIWEHFTILSPQLSSNTPEGMEPVTVPKARVEQALLSQTS